MRHWVWRLDGHTPVPCTEPDSNQNRVVGFANTKYGLVSTVFLMFDHSLDDKGPVLFETAVFGGALDGYMRRYRTWDDAATGHALTVELVKAQPRMEN